MTEQEEYLLNRFLIVVAIALFISGIVLTLFGCKFSYLFYSFGLLAVTAFLNLNWASDASDIGSNANNQAILIRLIFIVIVQAATIYQMSKINAFLGALVFGWSDFVWAQAFPVSYNGDAAGNGMARGCGFLFDIFKAVLLGLIFLLVVVFADYAYILRVVVLLIVAYFLLIVIGNYNRCIK